MSRRRRAALLIGLALVLGGLAASDVHRRERAIDRQLGRPVPVLVARTDIRAGMRLRPRLIVVRRVPARYAPIDALPSPAAISGLRTAAAIPAGAYVTSGAVADPAGDGSPGPAIGPGERVAEVVARGSPELVAPGGRVDVLVTREASGGAPGETVLALEDVEVLSAVPAGPEAGGEQAGVPRVAAALRVTLRQAVFLAAAQSFARELRLLARAPGDRRRGAAGMSVDARLAR